MRFALTPGAARLWVDGVERSWFGTVLHLAPGPHEVIARMPEHEPCCEDLAMRVEVEPTSADARRDQNVSLRLPIRPARASLLGAPAGGFLACANGLLVRQDSPGRTPMHEVQWTGPCYFLPLGTERFITLRAGQTTLIEWPR